MRVKYLLPCSCGKKVAIETAQAGQNILCSCGATLEVPTMQGIRRLEQSVDTGSNPTGDSSFGGAAIGIALLGFILLGAGGGYTAWQHTTQRPQLIDMDYMTPWDTWMMWHSLREGIQAPQYSESPYSKAMKVYEQSMIIGIAITVVGIVALLCSVLIAVMNGRSRRRRRPQKAP